MTKEEVIALAREAGLKLFNEGWTSSDNGDAVTEEALERFAALVAAHERNKIAAWMIDRGYATGHGDTTEDLLTELEWQISEREREGCAKVAESYEPMCDTCPSGVANAIRSRT